MRVLVIAGSNIRLSPYAFLYLNVLKEHKHNTTLAYWDRDGKPDVKIDAEIEVKRFFSILDDSTPKIKKIKHFIRFRKFLIGILKTTSFDFVVVLDTQFAVLIKDVLLKKYKNNYIFDMRDPSYERFAFYRKIVASLVKHSRNVVISSDGYRRYLPADERIITAHNLTIGYEKERKKETIKASDGNRIVLSFWGVIRDYELNLKIIDAFANNPFFLLFYHGTINNIADHLIKYCKENEITNVLFTGSYLPEQKKDFVNNTDIILNTLFSNEKYFNPRMTNKFYDGILYHIPQLAIEDSFMGNIIKSQGIGFTFKNLESLGDVPTKLFEYYNSLEFDSFNKACDLLLNKIISEQKKCETTLTNIFN